MSGHFFAILSRMKYITRWALMRNTRQENLCEHTQDVAVLAHGLAVLQNRRFGGSVDAGRCVLLALYHDAPEILTGDLPTPVKYANPAIRDAYRQVEDVSANKLLSMLPEDMRPEYREFFFPGEDLAEERRIVKAADKLSAYIKCVEELKAGNSEFAAAEKQTRQALVDMQLPCLDYFLAHFLDSFRLTLDELE